MHIGDMLLQENIITQQQLDSALEYQQSIGGKLGQILVKLGVADENTILSTLSSQMQIDVFDLTSFTPDPEVMSILPQDVIERVIAVPLRKEAGSLVVGLADPTDFAGLDEIRMHAGGSVESVLVSMALARDIIRDYFEGSKQESGEHPHKAPVRGRHGLSNLVHELIRDVCIQGIGQSDSPELEIPPELESQSDKKLILAMIAALMTKKILTEDEIAAALHSILRDKGILEALGEK